jgi:hypothetical protein
MLQNADRCLCCKADDLATWSSYDRTWFSGHDKQEIFILSLRRFVVCVGEFLRYVIVEKHVKV